MNPRLLLALPAIITLSCSEKDQAARSADRPSGTVEPRKVQGELSIDISAGRRTVLRVNGEPVRAISKESAFATIAGYPLKAGGNTVAVEFLSAPATQDEPRLDVTIAGSGEPAPVAMSPGDEGKQLAGQFTLAAAMTVPGSGQPGQISVVENDKLIRWTTSLFSKVEKRDEAGLRAMLDEPLTIPVDEWAPLMSDKTSGFTAIAESRMTVIRGNTMALVIADPGDENAHLASGKLGRADFSIEGLAFFRDQAGGLYLMGAAGRSFKVKLD